MNTISFMTANYVAREIGYNMTKGWMEGDDATNAWFASSGLFPDQTTTNWALSDTAVANPVFFLGHMTLATSANSADVSNSIRGVRNPKTKDGAGKRYGECCGAQ